MTRKKYTKNAEQTVTAVQITLKTEGFSYEKWGGQQQCKFGDWLVNNNGDCYTVEEDSFAKTYEMLAPGQYRKTAPVWAEQATTDGSVKTKEGETHYKAGDYLVANNEDGTDAYAISKSKFETMYQLAQ